MLARGRPAMSDRVSQFMLERGTNFPLLLSDSSPSPSEWSSMSLRRTPIWATLDTSQICGGRKAEEEIKYSS